MIINGIDRGDAYSLAYMDTNGIVTRFGLERDTTLNFQKKTYEFKRIGKVFSVYDTFEGTFNGYLGAGKKTWDNQDALKLYLLKIDDVADAVKEIYLGTAAIDKSSVDFSLGEVNKVTVDFRGYIANKNIMEEL